jgi:multidrug efflux pump subunit AcrB
MIVWKYLNGSFFSGPIPYLDYGTNLFKPVHFFDVMFSSKNGLFFYHPFLLIAVVGLIIYLKKEWVISIIFLLAFLCTLYLISCWAVWFAGASFGHRMFVSSGIMFAFGFAAFYKHIFRENKFIVIFLFLIFFLWNIGLIVQYSTKMIPHQDYVPFKTIVQNQFKKVPNEFISHIKQFFKNKESFRI